VTLNKTNPNTGHETLAAILRQELTSDYGPIVSDENLCLLLGYKSMAAFRQAIYRKTVPIRVFGIKGRKGKFALIRDVASWLAEQHEGAEKVIAPRIEIKEVSDDVAH
jgi:hypothetical protein